MLKSGFINTTLSSFKSRTGSQILTILALNIKNNKVKIPVKCQGHRVKGEGCIHPQQMDLI